MSRRYGATKSGLAPYSPLFTFIRGRCPIIPLPLHTASASSPQFLSPYLTRGSGHCPHGMARHRLVRAGHHLTPLFPPSPFPPLIFGPVFSSNPPPPRPGPPPPTPPPGRAKRWPPFSAPAPGGGGGF